jgi:D-aminopeptidase
MPEEHDEGSCIVITATDAPMVPHQLRRIAQRSGLGLARCGSVAHNGSGELMLAFSTTNRIPLETPDGVVPLKAVLDGGSWEGPSPINDLFQATIEATEEAVVNALFMATTVVGHDGNTLHALPIDRTLELLERHGRLDRR